MKKVIASVVLMLGLSVNAYALSPIDVVKAGVMPAVFAGFIQATQVKYEACNDKPYTTVSHATGSNYTFSVSECELKAKPGAYKVK